MVMAVPEFEIERYNTAERLDATTYFDLCHRFHDFGQYYGSKGYYYHIKFPESNRPSGKVVLMFKNVGNLLTPSWTYQELIENGLKDNDEIAIINSFYPNSAEADEITGKYMNEGVGSEILEIIKSDSRSVGAKAIVVTTMHDSLKIFLRKKEFTYDNKPMQNNYLLLN